MLLAASAQAWLSGHIQQMISSISKLVALIIKLLVDLAFQSVAQSFDLEVQVLERLPSGWEEI